CPPRRATRARSPGQSARCSRGRRRSRRSARRNWASIPLQAERLRPGTPRGGLHHSLRAAQGGACGVLRRDCRGAVRGTGPRSAVDCRPSLGSNRPRPRRGACVNILGHEAMAQAASGLGETFDHHVLAFGPRGVLVIVSCAGPGEDSNERVASLHRRRGTRRDRRQDPVACPDAHAALPQAAPRRARHRRRYAREPHACRGGGAFRGGGRRPGHDALDRRLRFPRHGGLDADPGQGGRHRQAGNAARRVPDDVDRVRPGRDGRQDAGGHGRARRAVRLARRRRRGLDGRHAARELADRAARQCRGQPVAAARDSHRGGADLRRARRARARCSLTTRARLIDTSFGKRTRYHRRGDQRRWFSSQREDTVTATATPATLRRELGVFGATMMGLGAMIGTGIFVSVGLAAGAAGGTVVAAILLAAGVAACNALSSAQLAASHAVSGGTYEYGYRYLNHWLGFTAGWVFVCAKTASAATAALGFAGYFSHLVGVSPALRPALAAGAAVLFTAPPPPRIRRPSRANAALLTLDPL